MVPRFLVKHQSRYCCDSTYWMLLCLSRLGVQQMTLQNKDEPHPKSVEGLKWKAWVSWSRKKFCLWLTFGLKSATSTLTGIPRLLAHLEDFKLSSLHNYLSQFLHNQSFFLSLFQNTDFGTKSGSIRIESLGMSFMNWL